MSKNNVEQDKNMIMIHVTNDVERCENSEEKAKIRKKVQKKLNVKR